MVRKIISVLLFAVGSIGFLTIPIGFVALFLSADKGGAFFGFLLLTALGVASVQQGLKVGSWLNRNKVMGVLAIIYGVIAFLASFGSRAYVTSGNQNTAGAQFASYTFQSSLIFGLFLIVAGIALFVISRKQAPSSASISDKQPGLLCPLGLLVCYILLFSLVGLQFSRMRGHASSNTSAPITFGAYSAVKPMNIIYISNVQDANSIPEEGKDIWVSCKDENSNKWIKKKGLTNKQGLVSFSIPTRSSGDSFAFSIALSEAQEGRSFRIPASVPTLGLRIDQKLMVGIAEGALASEN